MNGTGVERTSRQPQASWSDEDLIRACLDGEDSAWSALIEKYKNLVYSAPVKYRMSPEDAADIFQSVWLEAYKEMGKLRSPGAFRGWLMTVSTNKCFQWTRKAAVRGTPDGEAPEVADPRPLVGEVHLEMERDQMVREAITSLPDRCREMIRLLFFTEPPIAYKDLADRLGLAEGSIGFIRGRCLKKMRAALEQRGF
jgi:RNA polymerase sigma factor (sigma-70 family)